MNVVSLIIPVCNGAPYLAAAIDSALAQTRPPDEIIVVDDGSTDSSGDIARAFGLPVRCVTQINQGQAAARNTGVMQAQGNVLAFLDADDLWLPDKLARQLTALNASPPPDMIFGQVEQFYSPDITAQTPPLAEKQILTGLHVGAMLIAAETFQRVGLFRTDIRVGEFLDWYSRAKALQLSSLVLSHVVMRRRLHDKNLMRHNRHMDRDYLQILRQATLRRRTNG